MIKMGFKKFGKVFNLSVWPLVLLWQRSAQCLASHCRLPGSRNVESLHDFSPPSPTSNNGDGNLTHGIQLGLCSSSGLCGIFYEVPQDSSYAACFSPSSHKAVDVTIDHLCRKTEEQARAHQNTLNTSPDTCLIESKHQCVVKEQFLSSSKVCSIKLLENSQWIIFLIQQYTLGI